MVLVFNFTVRRRRRRCRQALFHLLLPLHKCSMR